MFTRQQLLGITGPIHRRLRMQKCNLFFEALTPDPTDSLLDVGGSPGAIGEFLDLYLFFKSVRVVNLDPEQVVKGDQFKHVDCDVADGCELPFENASFDWVFSNAVIEHVGGPERQLRFANEIRRVARKGFFVATPNRYFPVDPHTLLPFYQFLSPEWQRRVCGFSPGYLKTYEPINLLSSRMLEELFPGAVVSKLGIPVFHNNLVAYRKS